jgi:hypothetical protein
MVISPSFHSPMENSTTWATKWEVLAVVKFAAQPRRERRASRRGRNVHGWCDYIFTNEIAIINI